MTDSLRCGYVTKCGKQFPHAEPLTATINFLCLLFLCMSRQVLQIMEEALVRAQTERLPILLHRSQLQE